MRAGFACFIGRMARRVGATERGIACLPSSPTSRDVEVPRRDNHFHGSRGCPFIQGPWLAKMRLNGALGAGGGAAHLLRAGVVDVG